MSFLLRRALVLFFLSLTTRGQSQTWKFWKREKTEQIGPKEAAENKAKAAEKQNSEYATRKKTHEKAQDRKTRKRMKSTLKRAERYSWGKQAPWYRRWFGKTGGKHSKQSAKKNLL
jgi:hypothetical protein